MGEMSFKLDMGSKTTKSGLKRSTGGMKVDQMRFQAQGRGAGIDELKQAPIHRWVLRSMPMERMFRMIWPGDSSKEHKRNWARLIQKIYEIDPLCCSACSGKMKVISIIERPDVIKLILRHLGLWDGKVRPPPASLKTNTNSLWLLLP